MQFSSTGLTRLVPNFIVMPLRARHGCYVVLDPGRSARVRGSQLKPSILKFAYGNHCDNIYGSIVVRRHPEPTYIFVGKQGDPTDSCVVERPRSPPA
jgi:hypothetical protein